MDDETKKQIGEEIVERRLGCQTMSDERPFCCRCKEDFRVGNDDGIFRMGELQKLKRAPKFIRKQFQDWLNSEFHGEGYLCGNCYFDLTDEAS